MDRVCTVYEVLFHRARALQTPSTFALASGNSHIPTFHIAYGRFKVRHFALGRFGERCFTLIYRITLIPSIFPPFACSPDNVDTVQAWLNRYLSHGNDLKMRGQGPYGNVPLSPSTGIFVSRIHTEISFRVGLEFNKKKNIRLVSVIFD